MSEKNSVNSTRRRFIGGSLGMAAAGVAGSLLAVKSVRAENAGSAKSAVDFRHVLPTRGMAFRDYSLTVSPYDYASRALQPHDVAIDIRYCGICHSDIHAAQKDWGEQIMPQVPGHEISGVVLAVGSAVTKFKVGDRVAVGTMVDSCGHCGECRADLEQYCENGVTYTYGVPTDKKLNPSGITQGGYANRIVVTEHFVCRVPDKLAGEHAGVLMCAGITVYSPLRHWNVRQGQTIGVVGMGGLGHLAVKFAKALGADVVVFTTSPDKTADAKRFGAADVVVNYDEKKMAQYRKKLDFILATVPYQFNIDPFFPLLKRDGTFCLVGIGAGNQPNQLAPFDLIFGRNRFAGSQTGGMRETQEVLDFCAEHGIKPETHLIKPNQINQAWRDVKAKKARYRYVIDTAGL